MALFRKEEAELDFMEVKEMTSHPYITSQKDRQKILGSLSDKQRHANSICPGPTVCGVCKVANPKKLKELQEIEPIDRRNK